MYLRINTYNSRWSHGKYWIPGSNKLNRMRSKRLSNSTVEICSTFSPQWPKRGMKDKLYSDTRYIIINLKTPYYSHILYNFNKKITAGSLYSNVGLTSYSKLPIKQAQNLGTSFKWDTRALLGQISEWVSEWVILVWNTHHDENMVLCDLYISFDLIMSREWYLQYDIANIYLQIFTVWHKL